MTILSIYQVFFSPNILFNDDDWRLYDVIIIMLMAKLTLSLWSDLLSFFVSLVVSGLVDRFWINEKKNFGSLVSWSILQLLLVVRHVVFFRMSLIYPYTIHEKKKLSILTFFCTKQFFFLFICLMMRIVVYYYGSKSYHLGFILLSMYIPSLSVVSIQLCFIIVRDA